MALGLSTKTIKRVAKPVARAVDPLKTADIHFKEYSKGAFSGTCATFFTDLATLSTMPQCSMALGLSTKTIERVAKPVARAVDPLKSGRYPL